MCATLGSAVNQRDRGTFAGGDKCLLKLNDDIITPLETFYSNQGLNNRTHTTNFIDLSSCKIGKIFCEMVREICKIAIR